MLRLLLAACFFSATAAVAEPARLSDGSIREMLAGSLIEVDTPLGTTIAVRFSSVGLVSGEAGSLASVLGAAKDRGRWWTKDDHLCVKWFRWFEAETRCAVIRRDGNQLFWQGTDGKTSTGRIAQSSEAGPGGRAAHSATKVAAAATPEPAHRTQQQATAEANVSAPEPAAVEAPAPGSEPPAAVAAAPEDPASASSPASAAPAAVAAASETPAEAAGAEPSAQVAAAAIDAAPGISAPFVAGPVSLPESNATALAAARIAAPFMTVPVRTVPISPPLSERSRFALAAAFPSSLTFAAEQAEIAAAPQPPAEPASPPPAARTKAASRPASGKVRASKAAILASAVTRPTFRVAGVEDNDALNVRSGPSQNSQIVGAIDAEGSGVIIVGPCRASWCPIEHDRVRGWVNRNFLAAENVQASSLR